MSGHSCAYAKAQWPPEWGVGDYRGEGGNLEGSTGPTLKVLEDTIGTE